MSHLESNQLIHIAKLREFKRVDVTQGIQPHVEKMVLIVDPHNRKDRSFVWMGLAIMGRC